MTSGLIAILSGFTISRVRNKIFNIKLLLICYNLNSTVNRFIVLITKDRGLLIFKIKINKR